MTEEKSCICNNFVNDHYRFIITRWRLSNHKLKIETDRYNKTKTDRSDRTCSACGIVEDEYHVIFKCPTYDSVRTKYPKLAASDDISVFLNPVFGDIIDTAKFILDIEGIRGDSS